MSKLKLIAPKPYRVRPNESGGGAITIPAGVFLFGALSIHDRLWIYENEDGNIVLSRKKLDSEGKKG